MAKYKVIKVEEVENRSDPPAEMRMMGSELGSDQIALTYRRFPKGFKRAHGHTHSAIDEAVYIISGTLQIRLDGDVVEAGPNTVVMIPPDVKRGYHNEGDEDVEALIVSVQGDMVDDNGGTPDPDWWPAD